MPINSLFIDKLPLTIMFCLLAVAKALKMDNFTLSEKADRVTDIGVVSEPENVVIGGSSLLLSRHILMQVGDNVALGLEICRSKRRSGGGDGIDSGCVVDEIGVEAACLDFVD